MICKMAVCMFWLLTYVGQGLDLAVGNRPVIIQVQDTQGLDYRHGSGSIRKKSELSSSVGNNLLHLRLYPSDGPHRDDLSNWLVFNDEPRISSWSPAGMLIDDIVKEPRELQNVFFALSPAVLNVLYSEHATSQQSHATTAAEPFVYDEGNQLINGRHQQQQQLHHQRAKKRRIGCRHPKGPLSLPILVCDEAGRKTTTLQEPRQSNYDDLYAEQRFNTATKTDLARAEGGTPVNLSPNGGFIPRTLVYEAGKPPGSKRSQITVGRRSIDAQGESPGHQAQGSSASSTSSAGTSIASQLMLRSIRGSIQYDVPQIECPVSEDGMERFACPTADRMGRFHCIDDHVLCDGFLDCPTGEDEDRQACLFYKTTKAHLDVLADAILRWARGR
ncbi:uncharacterized protein jeb [Linepithema humile]|uniref:uncharacterized protein jeb n=1 Tax=Linepithema humile TaxID=83485 RepID=UPI00062355B2|nr:PREDICTED: uncharacterized protein LOC105674062 [Linepithema humile]XP_012225564.1 PREDICTED: uncharacterized protein LOC105674062 [Linepithema humile]